MTACERDRHFTNPPSDGLLLNADQLAWLKVLLDNAVPREADGPMAWEGVGRRVAESYLGYRQPCTCVLDRDDWTHTPGCPVHDPEGAAS